MSDTWNHLAADRQANRHNSKGTFIVSSYRIGRVLAANASRLAPLKVFSVPYGLVYKMTVIWLLGVDLPLAVEAGPGLVVYHGVGLVVHERCVLGAGVTLRQGCTLGSRGSESDAPVPSVGDGVEFGASCIVLGGVRLGDDCRIGAGAVVLTDVPAKATAVGNPARVLVD